MIWATPEKRVRLIPELFLISFLSLYSELIVIRWLTSEIRVFAYFKNLPLMASFLGLGLGCARYRSPRRLFPWFSWLFGPLACFPPSPSRSVSSGCNSPISPSFSGPQRRRCRSSSG